MAGRTVVARLVLALVGLAIGIAGVLAMREATLSTHQHVEPDSEAVVLLQAETKGSEPGQTRSEAVEALLLTCRLEVGMSNLVEGADLGDGRYRAVFRPGMDETNQRQLRGCLEDWAIDHLRVDVLSITHR
jgi:hypothetical protein